MSLKCGVELEIPDIIQKHGQGQPMTISELVSALSIHPSKVPGLHRLMRTLVHSGFFAIEHKNSGKETGYVLTPASRLLLKDNPLSARSFLLVSVDPFIMEPWKHASAWFQSDCKN